MQNPANDSGSLVASYLTLRRAVGVLGIALPFILSLGALVVFMTGTIEESISHYYYTGMRNVLVGTLFAIGGFLMSYKGYEKKDDRAGDIACVAAIGVALFPTTPSGEPTNIIGIVHGISAAVFFLTLAFFSLYLFTKTDPNKTPTRMKKKRNIVYKISGWVIVASIVLILLYYSIPYIRVSLEPIKPVFWLESAAVIAFGISWLTKGEAILRDET